MTNTENMTNRHKWSNLYDVDGELIRKAPQRNWTIEETEELLNKLTEKVKQNPDNKVYRVYLNNTYKTLMWMYSKYGNPHEQELITKLKEYEQKKAAGEYDVDEQRDTESAPTGDNCAE